MNSRSTYNPNNGILFNNEQFIKSLMMAIRSKLGRNIQITEKKFILTYFRKTDHLIFKNRSYQDIITVMRDDIISQLIKLDCANREIIDVHEMMKSEIGVSTDESENYIDSKKNVDFSKTIATSFNNKVDVDSFLGNNSIESLQKIINPELVKVNSYILLDTRYRILEDDGTNQFVWNFVNNESVSQGSVNAIGDIQNITAMRVYPIRIPYNSGADNEYDRVSLYIQEFSAQSFIAQENRRFHFLFDTSVEDRWINLNPFNFNDGYFRFRNPIARLEQLTISFGRPLDPVVFDTDRMNAEIDNADYGTVTQFTTTSNHNLETGDFVYITGFTSQNPISDNAAISAINTTDGNIITYTGLNTFTVDVDTSSFNTTGPTGSSVYVANGSNTVYGTSTNFITLFQTNDKIIISGVTYTVNSVLSDTELTITSVYAGITIPAPGVAANYKRYNIVNGLFSQVYFASKRIFIPIELEYYKA